ncbi:unnamed protein product [Oncorhynchus mykiss]|uniref:Uncharacterized protein n=1 Tax=Oncorhynchus mykiss TaxID=8022 RepID=A0A060YEC7_ONCMY|nr:unnamed protein product [Oncorhynchus mykiss]
MCSQLDHVQNFISWATAHHLKNPLLLSRELISLQMQRLLEPPLHSDAWLPVKIKFNWDASYWTKQISTLGQLTAEGGNRSYSEGVAFPSILRPQPITCLSLPSVCHWRAGAELCLPGLLSAPDVLPPLHTPTASCAAGQDPAGTQLLLRQVCPVHPQLSLPGPAPESAAQVLGP